MFYYLKPIIKDLNLLKLKSFVVRILCTSLLKIVFDTSKVSSDG